MNHAAVTHHLLWTSCTGWIDFPPPFTKCHIVGMEQKVASGFCGWPTSWMRERPGWLSCKTASSAFYHCKSFHITGIRSRRVGREGDSEQKREKDGEGGGGWECGVTLKSHLKEKAVFICTVFHIVTFQLLFLWSVRMDVWLYFINIRSMSTLHLDSYLHFHFIPIPILPIYKVCLKRWMDICVHVHVWLRVHVWHLTR